MKKHTCLMLSLFLAFSLVTAGCTNTDVDNGQAQAELSPAERAQKFLTEADNVYADQGPVEMYGETVPLLVPALNGDGHYSLYQAYTDAMNRLKNVDLSAYQEIDAVEETVMPPAAFYTGIGDEKCQITLYMEPTMTDMTIHFLFDDGEEYLVAGPYSQDLLIIREDAEGTVSERYDVDGSIWITGGDGERRLLTRGNSVAVLTIFDLTIEHTEPIQDPGDTAFDCLLEVVGGKSYQYDSEHFRFQEDGSEAIYEIQCNEDYAYMLGITLR